MCASDGEGGGMRRREFITLLGGSAAAVGLRPLEARAQGSTKPRRIGVLSQDLAGAHPTPVFQAFLDGLRELGWLEGHNLAIEWRFSEGSLEPLPRLAAELVARPVELIVASPARPARVAKEATNTIPVARRAKVAQLAADHGLPVFSQYSE